MTDLEAFLKEATRTEEEFIAVVDGNPPQTLIYSSSAYDGSPYGASGFADENGNYMPEDMIESARWPEDSERLGLQTDDERTEELILREEERIEGIRLDKARARREQTKRNREILERRYEQVFSTKPEKMTMKAMRDAINARNAKESLTSIASVMRGFGF